MVRHSTTYGLPSSFLHKHSFLNNWGGSMSTQDEVLKLEVDEARDAAGSKRVFCPDG